MAVHETNIAILFFIFALFLVSLILKWNKRYFVHGTLMLVAAISYLPPLVLSLDYLLTNHTVSEVMEALFGNFLTLTILLVHFILGAYSGFLVIWLLVSWRFRASTLCAKNKKKMRTAAKLWIIAHILGILLYASLYTNLLQNTWIGWH